MAKTVTETTQDSDSVEVDRNAKGQYSWTCKVYGTDWETMRLKLKNMDQDLRAEYDACMEVSGE